MCIYMNQRYCNTVVVCERICTPEIELLAVCLYQLSQEFLQLFYTVVGRPAGVAKDEEKHPRAITSAAAHVNADIMQTLDSSRIYSITVAYQVQLC